MSKKHSCPRQVHARVMINQEPRIDERLELTAVYPADIYGIAGIHVGEVDALVEAKASEERLFQPFLGREHTPLTTDLSSTDHACDVLSLSLIHI